MKKSPSHISNVKVEVIASEILDKELAGDIRMLHKYVDVNLLGDEKRGYRSEVESFKKVDKEYTININKASLYDTLPEVLFHKPKIKNDYNLDNIKEGFQKLQQEEKQARKFFKVFDREVVNVLIAKEVHSRKNEEDQWLEEIWPLPKNFNDRQKSLFWKFLPFIEDIKHNKEYAIEFISRILGTDINVEVKAAYVNIESQTALDSIRLGMDSVLTGQIEVPRKLLEVTLVNPSSEVFLSFFTSQTTQNIIEYLVELVFPADYTLVIKLGDIDSKSAQIGSNSDCGILGFSLYI